MKIILLLLALTTINLLSKSLVYPSQHESPRLLDHPLHYLAFRGHHIFLDYWAQRGDHNINSSDHLGRTPLHCAAAAGHQEAVETLILLDAEVEVRDNNGLLPADLARLNGHRELSTFLQEYQSLDSLEP